MGIWITTNSKLNKVMLLWPYFNSYQKKTRLLLQCICNSFSPEEYCYQNQEKTCGLKIIQRENYMVESY